MRSSGQRITPVEDASAYQTNFKRLKSFAYKGSGLSMSAAKAIEYALEKIDSFCADSDIETEFQELYSFAYSRAYAIKKMGDKAFQCTPFELK